MESNNGTIVLHSELANRFKDLQKSSGFKTTEAFMQHLFSLEEKIRTNGLKFATVFAGVEQPWFEKDSSKQDPGTASSVGVQVNLCCRSRHRTIAKETQTVATKSGFEEESSAEWYQRKASDNDDEEEQDCLDANFELKNRCDSQKRDCKPADIISRRVTIKLLIKNKPPKVGYQCKECGRSFRMKVSYLNHLRAHVGDSLTFQCKLCNLAFTNKWNLSQHISVKHPEQVPKAKEKSLTTRLCHVCGCEMKSQQTLKSHLRTHSADKPYKCVHCSKTFKWSSALEYHIRTHTGERPHHCHKCGKAFINRSDLTRHRTVHTGEKPHKCTQCDKAFTQSHSLTSHVNRCHRRAQISALLIDATDLAKAISPHQTQKSSHSFVQMSPPVTPLVKLAVDPVQFQTNLLIQEQALIGANLGLDNSLGGQVHNLAERDLAETMVNMLPSS